MMEYAHLALACCGHEQWVLVIGDLLIGGEGALRKRNSLVVRKVCVIRRVLKGDLRLCEAESLFARAFHGHGRLKEMFVLLISHVLVVPMTYEHILVVYLL